MVEHARSLESLKPSGQILTEIALRTGNPAVATMAAIITPHSPFVGIAPLLRAHAEIGFVRNEEYINTFHESLGKVAEAEAPIREVLDTGREHERQEVTKRFFSDPLYQKLYHLLSQLGSRNGRVQNASLNSILVRNRAISKLYDRYGTGIGSLVVAGNRGYSVAAESEFRQTLDEAATSFSRDLARAEVFDESVEENFPRFPFKDVDVFAEEAASIQKEAVLSLLTTGLPLVAGYYITNFVMWQEINGVQVMDAKGEKIPVSLSTIPDKLNLRKYTFGNITNTDTHNYGLCTGRGYMIAEPFHLEHAFLAKTSHEDEVYLYSKDNFSAIDDIRARIALLGVSRYVADLLEIIQTGSEEKGRAAHYLTAYRDRFLKQDDITIAEGAESRFYQVCLQDPIEMALRYRIAHGLPDIMRAENQVNRHAVNLFSFCKPFYVKLCHEYLDTTGRTQYTHLHNFTKEEVAQAHGKVVLTIVGTPGSLQKVRILETFDESVWTDESSQFVKLALEHFSQRKKGVISLLGEQPVDGTISLPAPFGAAITSSYVVDTDMSRPLVYGRDYYIENFSGYRRLKILDRAVKNIAFNIGVFAKEPPKEDLPADFQTFDIRQLYEISKELQQAGFSAVSDAIQHSLHEVPFDINKLTHLIILSGVYSYDGRSGAPIFPTDSSQIVWEKLSEFVNTSDGKLHIQCDEAAHFLQSIVQSYLDRTGLYDKYKVVLSKGYKIEESGQSNEVSVTAADAHAFVSVFEGNKILFTLDATPIGGELSQVVAQIDSAPDEEDEIPAAVVELADVPIVRQFLRGISGAQQKYIEQTPLFAIPRLYETFLSFSPNIEEQIKIPESLRAEVEMQTLLLRDYIRLDRRPDRFTKLYADLKVQRILFNVISAILDDDNR